jgi:hypothetical protein
MSSKLVSADKLHAKWMKDARYRKAYEELEEEFRLASVLIDAQARTDISQDRQKKPRQ